LSSFVTSIALGNDLICRLSFPSLCQLRNEILDSICRAKVNKFYIMRAMFKDFHPNDLMYEEGEEPDSVFKMSVEEYQVCIFLDLYDDKKFIDFLILEKNA
jgi:hypothetical protein